MSRVFCGSSSSGSWNIAESSAITRLPCLRPNVSPEPPLVRDVAGKHDVFIGGLTLSRDGRRGAVVATIDNLLGGAASQALRNLNLALGFPERQGLSSDASP